MSVPSHEETSAHAPRYEEIRKHVVEQRSFSDRFGLAVLVNKGMAAWIEQWLKISPTKALLSPTFQKPSALPDAANADVIQVLATMTLSHIQEVQL